MKFKVDTTTDILNGQTGMALIGKVFEKISMDMSGNHVISDARKSVIKTMAGSSTG